MNNASEVLLSFRENTRRNVASPHVLKEFGGIEVSNWPFPEYTYRFAARSAHGGSDKVETAVVNVTRPLQPDSSRIDGKTRVA